MNEVKLLVNKFTIKGINFDRVKKNKNNKKSIWDTYKNKWFHNCPKLITKKLWIPILIDIAKYYNDITLNIIPPPFTLNGRQIELYLKKRVKCSNSIYLRNKQGKQINKKKKHIIL